MTRSREADAFDLAFRRRAPRLQLHAERDSDRGFLIALFIECSPLRAMLPQALLHQQADAQQASQRQNNPGAMRRIVAGPSGPIGRIAIDWRAGDHSYGVDVAVLPEARHTGAGLHMLRAWLDVADQFGRPCRLEVLRGNPAARLYARLGFRASPFDDLEAPVVAMERKPAP